MVTNESIESTCIVIPEGGVDYPRIQILTIKEIVEEKRRFQTPTKIGTKAKGEQIRLPV